LVVRVLLTPPAAAAASQKWKIIYLQVLRLSNSFEVEENTIERQCDAEFFAHIKDQAASCDAILSMACGDCTLGIFGGVCPVTRYSKSLLNGPCGSSVDGKCEVDPENIDCGWHLIYDRLKTLDKLDVLAENPQPRDFSQTHDGGPRKLSREDIAEL